MAAPLGLGNDPAGHDAGAPADAQAVADWRARRTEGEQPEPWDPAEYDQ